MARINFTQEIMGMIIGEEMKFPAITFDKVDSTVKSLSLKYGRKYKTRRNAEGKYITVTRLK